MKKTLKTLSIMMLACLTMIFAVACGNLGAKECSTAETVTLQNATLGEVEFTNSDTVTLQQNCDNIEIGGTIEAMTAAQKSTYGVQSVTHAVTLKIEFDKQRTLDSVEVKGGVTKVYSSNSGDANYSGSLTDFLDSETGEDAYANLILSAQTKDYTITAKYTDNKESKLNIKISATLATADAE